MWWQGKEDDNDYKLNIANRLSSCWPRYFAEYFPDFDILAKCFVADLDILAEYFPDFNIWTNFLSPTQFLKFEKFYAIIWVESRGVICQKCSRDTLLVFNEYFP